MSSHEKGDREVTFVGLSDESGCHRGRLSVFVGDVIKAGRPDHLAFYLIRPTENMASQAFDTHDRHPWWAVGQNGVARVVRLRQRLGGRPHLTRIGPRRGPLHCYPVSHPNFLQAGQPRQLALVDARPCRTDQRSRA